MRYNSSEGININSLTLINTFIKNTKEIIKQVTHIDIQSSQPYKTNKLIFTECLMVSVGVSGFFAGQILVFFNENLALFLSSKMQEDILFVTVDNQVKESILDISKLIIANSLSKMYENGISFEINSTGILQGSHIKYFSDKQEVVCIPFEIAEGKMIICLQNQHLFKDNEGNK